MSKAKKDLNKLSTIFELSEDIASKKMNRELLQALINPDVTQTSQTKNLIAILDKYEDSVSLKDNLLTRAIRKGVRTDDRNEISYLKNLIVMGIGADTPDLICQLIFHINNNDIDKVKQILNATDKDKKKAPGIKSSKFDVNISDIYGESALIAALKIPKIKPEIIKILLNYGANPILLDRNNELPSEIALKFVRKTEQDWEKSGYKNDNLEKIHKDALEISAMVNMKEIEFNNSVIASFNRDLLKELNSAKSSKEILTNINEILKNAFKQRIIDKEWFKNNRLGQAIEKDDVKQALKMMNAGIGINTSKHLGDLIRLVESGNSGKLKSYFDIRRKAKESSDLLSKTQESSLDMNLKERQYLSDSLSMNMNEIDINGDTLLTKALKSKHDSRYELVKLLLDNDVNINSKDKNGNNVLMIAVARNDEKMVELLLKSGYRRDEAALEKAVNTKVSAGIIEMLSEGMARVYYKNKYLIDEKDHDLKEKNTTHFTKAEKINSDLSIPSSSVQNFTTSGQAISQKPRIVRITRASKSEKVGLEKPFQSEKDLAVKAVKVEKPSVNPSQNESAIQKPSHSRLNPEKSKSPINKE